MDSGWLAGWRAASSLAAKLAAPLGWLVARLLTSPSPGIRCEIMRLPRHPLQMSDNWTQRERE